MAFTIKQNKLLIDDEAVKFVKSTFTGGAFASTPKILVMHFTYGASARSSAEWFRNPSNPGSSAHIVVDRDGKVLQCVDFKTVAWHAGKSRLGNLVGLNKFSIGIEMANWGYLKRSRNKWTSYTGAKIADPVLATHKNGNPEGSNAHIGWEPYSEEQFLSAVDIARALVKTYGIQQIVGHDDIAPGRKWDPGPAFDMIRFKARVFGDRDNNGDSLWLVAVQSGLNLRSGPGTQFESLETLPKGTKLDMIEKNGNWASVSVMNNDGEPRATGWVHNRYLAEA
jgi:N-acetylmuramoyl-L-alanine amidase